jgi:hypothetical protein
MRPAVLLLMAILMKVDSSRLFHLPLTKLHRSADIFEPPKARVQHVVEISNGDEPIAKKSDIPSLTMESTIYSQLNKHESNSTCNY